MKLIDTHSHIHFSKNFPDFDEVLMRAKEVGVCKQVLVGCDIEDSFEAFKIAKNFEDLFWTFGIHPHSSNQGNEKIYNELNEILSGKNEEFKKSPVAIGEIGLDYFRNLQSKEVQKETFIKQLNIAKEFNLPVILHIRDAFEDTFKILEKEKNNKVLLHCFSGGIKEADWAWSRGFIVSFSGIVTYKKNLDLQECAKNAPKDLFVVETDCPYLAPQKFRGQRNEPAFVVETAKFIAELKNISIEELAEMTTKNAEKYFNI